MHLEAASIGEKAGLEGKRSETPEPGMRMHFRRNEEGTSVHCLCPLSHDKHSADLYLKSSIIRASVVQLRLRVSPWAEHGRV